MRVQITHLKAPWPAGAKVGDVVDMPAVPVWATGKCIPAPDGAVVTVGVLPVPAVPVWATGKCIPAPDGAVVTVGVLPVEVAGDEVTGDGSGDALPPIDLPPAEAKTAQETKPAKKAK